MLLFRTLLLSLACLFLWCHYDNDRNCGYTRRRVNTTVPTPVTFNLSAIDDGINFLQSSHWSRAYSKQKQSKRLNSKASFLLRQAKKAFLMPPPWMFVASWCLRIPKVKRKFISPNALILAKGASLFSNVLYVLCIPQSIPILENYALSFLKLDAKEPGTELFCSKAP